MKCASEVVEFSTSPEVHKLCSMQSITRIYKNWTMWLYRFLRDGTICRTAVLRYGVLKLQNGWGLLL